MSYWDRVVNVVVINEGIECFGLTVKDLNGLLQFVVIRCDCEFDIGKVHALILLWLFFWKKVIVNIFI